jgi:hypothetical protein
LKPEQDDCGEQKMEYVSDDVRLPALALMGIALSCQSFARSPHAKSKPESHHKDQDQQYPENGAKCFFGTHETTRVRVSFNKTVA